MDKIGVQSKLRSQVWSPELKVIIKFSNLTLSIESQNFPKIYKKFIYHDSYWIIERPNTLLNSVTSQLIVHRNKWPGGPGAQFDVATNHEIDSFRNQSAGSAHRTECTPRVDDLSLLRLFFFVIYFVLFPDSVDVMIMKICSKRVKPSFVVFPQRWQTTTEKKKGEKRNNIDPGVREAASYLPGSGNAT